MTTFFAIFSYGNPISLNDERCEIYIRTECEKKILQYFTGADGIPNLQSISISRLSSFSRIDRII